MDNDIQKALMQRMGELTGKPKESGLSIHVLLNPERELGGEDPAISTISSRQRKSGYGHHVPKDVGPHQQVIQAWHSDSKWPHFAEALHLSIL